MGLPEEGICVTARELLKAVKALDSDIELKSDGETVTVFNKNQEIKIKTTFPADAFPASMTFKITESKTISCPVGDVLLDSLDYCKAAMSVEKTRLYLNGVALQTKGPEWTLVACDGHRLRCVKSNELLDNGEYDNSFIIPRKAITTLLNMKRKVAHTGLSSDGRKLLFIFDNGDSLVTKLINGSFPQWEKVVPEGSGDVVTIPNKKSAIKLLRGMINFVGKKHAVKIEQGITLTMKNDETEMTTNIDGNYDGNPFGLNADYLLQELNDCDTALEMIVSDAVSPIITIHGRNQKRFGVLMPRRV